MESLILPISPTSKNSINSLGDLNQFRLTWSNISASTELTQKEGQREFVCILSHSPDLVFVVVVAELLPEEDFGMSFGGVGFLNADHGEGSAAVGVLVNHMVS